MKAILPGTHLTDGAFEQAFGEPDPIWDVRAEKGVRVDPGKVALIVSRLPNEAQGLCLVSNHERNVERCISVVEGIVDCAHRLYCLPVRNIGLEPIFVPRFTRIGRLVPIRAEDVLITPKDPKPERTQTSAPNRPLISSLSVEEREKVVQELSPLLKMNSNLSAEQLDRVWAVFSRFRSVFCCQGDPIGRVDVEYHTIDTGDHKPVFTPPYRASPKDKKFIEETIQELLDQGLIVPIRSAWAVPVVLVTKKNGQIRFCCDFRSVNRITKLDKYPLPRVDDGLESLSGNAVFSVLDFKSMFWQIPMHPDSNRKNDIHYSCRDLRVESPPLRLDKRPSRMCAGHGENVLGSDPPVLLYIFG